MHESIVAVVVTFNRKDLLAECLDGLLRQSVPLTRIVLVDNGSNDGTEEMLRVRGHLDQPLLHYRRYDQNLGGAGGFHEGIRIALEFNADWIWVMDDDAEPLPKTLEVLINSPRTLDTIGLACKKVGTDGNTQLLHIGRFDPRIGQICLNEAEYQHMCPVDYSSFVGLAMRSDAVRQAGLPRKDFFIWMDDLEYCLRLRRLGAIQLVPESVILHKDKQAPIRYRRLLWLKGTANDIGGYWKQLCGFRNTAYVMTTYGSWKGLQTIGYLLKQIKQICLFEDHKLFRIKWLTRYYRQLAKPVFFSLTPAQWRNETIQLGLSVYDHLNKIRWYWARLRKESKNKSDPTL